MYIIFFHCLSIIPSSSSEECRHIFSLSLYPSADLKKSGKLVKVVIKDI